MRKMRFVESNIPTGVLVQVRYTSRFRNPENSMHLPKWFTQCQLVDAESGEVLSFAHSNCDESDQPVKKIGRAIAVGRAFKRYWEASDDALQGL